MFENYLYIVIGGVVVLVFMFLFPGVRKGIFGLCSFLWKCISLFVDFSWLFRLTHQKKNKPEFKLYMLFLAVVCFFVCAYIDMYYPMKYRPVLSYMALYYVLYQFGVNAALRLKIGKAVVNKRPDIIKVPSSLLYKYFAKHIAPHEGKKFEKEIVQAIIVSIWTEQNRVKEELRILRATKGQVMDMNKAVQAALAQYEYKKKAEHVDRYGPDIKGGEL